MRTLTVHRGDRGTWLVREGDLDRATARVPVLRERLSIDVDGRHLVSRGEPEDFELVDEARGEAVLALRLVSATGRGSRDLTWALTHRDGRTLTWVYRPEEPREAGFCDPAGELFMRTGREVSIEAPATASTLRILLKMWSGAMKSQTRFVARVEDRAVGEAIFEAELPVLAVLAMWLQSYVESDSDFGTGDTS